MSRDVLVQYSSDRHVNQFVIERVREMRPNPFDPENRSATIAGIVEQSYYSFGRKRAKSIRITTH
jgi:hypothetical protein